MATAFCNYLAMLVAAPSFVVEAITCCMILVFTIVHIKSVESGGLLQIFLAVIKIVPFLILILFGLFFINPDLFMSPKLASSITDEFTASDTIFMLIVGISATNFSFDGLNAACFMSGEIKNPGKTLPRSIIVTTIVVAALYVCLSGVCTGFLSIDEISQSDAALALFASKLPFVGEYARIFLAVIALFVIAGAISSCLMTHARMPYAMAKDGMFFKAFGKIHPEYHTPYFSVGFLGVFTIFFFLLFDVSTLFKYFTFLSLIKNLLSIGTIFVLRKKSTYKPVYKCPCGYLMPILSIVISGFLALNFFFAAPVDSLIGLSATLVTGIPAYIFVTKKYNN